MNGVLSGRLAVFVVVAFLAIDANAQSEHELAQIVLQRNLTMKAMLKAYFPLLAVKNGKSTDLATASESIEKIKEGMTKALTLFPEGTARGEAPGSRARPEVWSEGEEFRGAADKLVATLEKLASTADSGDIDEFRAQLSSVETACLGCHEFKPSGGGKFRYPK
jgi:cytochrome c556